MLFEIFNLSFISGILSSIIATLIINFIKEMIIYECAPFSGIWFGNIYNQSGMLVDTYMCKLKQNKHDNTIKGKIYEEFPVGKSRRKYHCIGVVDGEFMILIAWPIRDYIIGKVNGCMYLKHEDDNVFKGYYMTEQNEKMDMAPITLKKHLIFGE